ncbi:MAG: hypothetical protein ABJE10_18925 [bacterium]
MHHRIVVAVLALALAGCKAKTEEGTSLEHRPVEETVVPPPTVDATPVSTAALRQLTWLIGTFRGTNTDGATPSLGTFFERNSLLDDSTLIVVSFADSTLSGKTDTTRYELHHDSLTNTGAGRYIASAISADSLTFGPLSGVDNFFTWRKESDSTWSASVYPFGTYIKSRSYMMTRIK